MAQPISPPPIQFSSGRSAAAPKLTQAQLKKVLDIIALSNPKNPVRLRRTLEEMNVRTDFGFFLEILPEPADYRKNVQNWQAYEDAVKLSKGEDLKAKARFVFKNFRSPSFSDEQFQVVSKLLETHTKDQVQKLLSFRKPVTDYMTDDQRNQYIQQVIQRKTKEVDQNAVFEKYKKGAKFTNDQFEFIFNLIKEPRNLQSVFPEGCLLTEENIPKFFTLEQRTRFQQYLREKNTPQVDRFGEPHYAHRLLSGETWYEKLGGEDQYGHDPRDIANAQETFLEVWKNDKKVTPDKRIITPGGNVQVLHQKNRVISAPKEFDGSQPQINQIKQFTFVDEDNKPLVGDKLNKAKDQFAKDQTSANPNADVVKYDSFIIRVKADKSYTVESFSKFETPVQAMKLNYNPTNIQSIEKHYVQHLKSGKPMKTIEGFDCLIEKGGRVLFAPQGSVNPDEPKTWENIRQISLFDEKGQPLEGNDFSENAKDFLRAFRNENFREKAKGCNTFTIDGKTGVCECTSSYDPKKEPVKINYSHYILPHVGSAKKKEKSEAERFKPWEPEDVSSK